MSSEVTKLKKSKTLKSDSQEVDDLTRFKLIHKYWLKKAPLTDLKGGLHKKALEKFIKKARKGTMKDNSSLDATLECDYSSLGSKKKNKNKKKFKQMVKDGFTQINTSMKIKGENNEANSPVKFQKVPKIKREEENSPFSSFKTSPKKIKVENNEELVNVNKNVESVDRVIKNKKKKRKSNATITSAESLDNTVDSNCFENTTLNTSIDSSLDAKFANSDSVFETSNEQNLTKKQKKKKKKKFVSFDASSALGEDVRDDRDNKQNENEQSIVNILSKKKKLSQLNTSQINVNNEMETTNVQTANKVEGKKEKKKRKFLEAKLAEENSFSNIKQELSVDGQPKKKRKMNTGESEVGDETAQATPKTGMKVKKKNKKLEGIVPGLNSQPTLTKFTSNKDESESEDLDDDDDETSFPRTPNNRSFNQRWDSEEKTSRTLFVGNLPTNVCKKNLMRVFKGFGNVESVRVRGAVPAKPTVPQKIANFRREYNKDVKSLSGFVVFSDKDAAEKALALNGQVFNGHHLRVDKAKSKNPSSGSKPHYNKSCSVFIGGLPYDIDDESIRNTFARCGTVENVRIIRDKETGKSKGFGFVQFQDECSIATALTLSGTEVKGREIRVSPYEDNAKRTSSSENPQFARNRIFNSAKKGNQGRSPRKFFNKNGRKNDAEDSGPKKSFKKMQKKWKIEKEKKKVASIFKNEE